MLVPSERIVLLVLITGLCLPALGCDKSSASRTTDQTDSSMDPLSELAVLEQRMRELGLPVAVVAEPGGSPPAEAEAFADEESDAGERRDKSRDHKRAGAQGGDTPDDMAAAAPGPSTGTVSPRCENLCDLSGAICELEAKICGLSELHSSDPTYANACSRAADDCEVASDACDHCAP